MRHTLRTIAFGSALCLGLTAGSMAFAQDSTATQSAPDQNQNGMHHGRGPMSPDQELTHLTKRLSLTSDQQSQIKPILQDRHDQMMSLHQDSSMSREDRMSKMRSLDENSNSKLEAVLTPDQKTKYEQMIADRKQHMQEMRAEHANGGQPQQ